MILLALLMGGSRSGLAGTFSGKPFDVKLNIEFTRTVTSPPDFSYAPVAPDEFGEMFAKDSAFNLRDVLTKPTSFTCNGPEIHFVELIGKYNEQAVYNIQKFMMRTKGGDPDNRIKYRFVIGSSGNGVGDIKGASACSARMFEAGTNQISLTTLIDNGWDANLPMPDTYTDRITIKIDL